MENLTGKVVRFTSNNGNEFQKDEFAVCLDGQAGLFLGLHGVNFGRRWFESNTFEIIPNEQVEKVLAEARSKYFS